jgi:hypothetical protein
MYIFLPSNSEIKLYLAFILRCFKTGYDFDPMKIVTALTSLDLITLLIKYVADPFPPRPY